MNKELYAAAIEKFGVETQIWMAIEEMSELIQAICKKKRGKNHNIEEEVVDCLIVLEQIKGKFGYKDDAKEFENNIKDLDLIYGLNKLKNYFILYLTDYDIINSNFRYMLQGYVLKIIKYSEQFDQELINKWMQIKEARLKELIEWS